MTNCPPNESGRPWETWAISTPPGLADGSSLIYNRTVEVHRTITQAAETPAVGETGYSGEEATTTPGPGVEGEQVLYTNITCAISPKAAGRAKGPLPADLVYKTSWTIAVPLGAIPEHGVRDRDILVDDEGYRYSVGAAGWTALGWNLECIRLEA